jgi:hypothetical protein
MSELKLESSSTADLIQRLQDDRERLLAEVAALTLSINRSQTQVELLKEAACAVLEYLAAPNPYGDPMRQRSQAIARMEDALVVNGCGVARFEVRSDAN